MGSLLGVSINKKASAQQDAESDVEEINNGSGNNKPFTPKELQSYWMGYLQTLPETEIVFRQCISYARLKVNPDYSIEVTLQNGFQKEKLEERSMPLLSYLRESLQNYAIQLNIVADSSKSTQKAFTDADKLQAMIKKNPKLEILRQRLGLELD